ncbi:DUF1446 domain-containing protein (plasmid) [Skermanella mucosa]|uniref:acyclic terpene utilization AtuA family protein n=1 Tax=Skermanella mucosa TaxID=1789672 RepID=UPI00192C2722|nr:acyclic terpene utilization AtuA family protein [Skermanella mucosa]UEM24723.1 DUF1446 domain-containing protein [Skermanella mucosa]
MEADVFRIGSGAGFSGDRLDAPGPVVDTLIAAGGPSAIIFETLGERTLALAQLARRSGGAGWEPLLELLLEPVLARCVRNGVRIIGNFGAADPAGAARLIAEIAARQGVGQARIAVVRGDDLLESAETVALLESVRCEPPLDGRPVAANLYLGARAIAEALDAGADIVVTGRVADPALALGPLVHHFGWDWDDWDRLAAGTLAGHLLECGAQVSGGYFADPGRKDVPDAHDIGFPIAEMTADGGFTITKAAGTGGCVTPATVKEQILYEVHDPAGYLTPDVVLDITGVTVEQVGPDRVAVAGARGRPRPETLKATVCYEGGWLGEGEISYAGPNAAARARLALDVLARRIPPGCAWRGDIIGVTSVFGDDAGRRLDGHAGAAGDDVRVRLAVAAPDRRSAERGAQEVLALYTCGPAGGGGVRTSVRPRINTASAYLPRAAVEARFTMLETSHA